MISTNKAPLLPPRGIFVSTRVLFDHEMVPHLKNTLLQLMALAWRSGSHTTPKLNYAVLAKVTGKDERTLRGHLTQLRSDHAALRLRYAEPGQFYVILADWLYRNDGPRGSSDQAEVRRLPALPSGVKIELVLEDGSRIPLPDQVLKNQNQEEEEEFNLNSELLLLLPDHDPDQSPETAETAGDGWEQGSEEQEEEEPAGDEERAQILLDIPEELRGRLLEKGLFAQLLGEVAVLAGEAGYSPDDLSALLDWSAADEPVQPAALFMGRLRKGARAPAEFLVQACPRCGMRGKHAPGCPRSYSADY